MSAVEKRKPRPAVFASRRALQDARRLGLEGVLELHVVHAILAGKKRRQPPSGMTPRCGTDERVAFLGARGELVARLRRTTTPLLKGPAWFVSSVQRAPNHDNHEGGTSP